MQTSYKLPTTSSAADEVLKKVREFKAQMTPIERGRLSSTAFQGRDEMASVVYDSFMEFIGWNGLFTFQEGAAAKMENDVLDICINLAGGDESSGANFTSGGTESNFCSLFAMRAWARKNKPQIKHPQIVAPYSTHSTIHKTAKYLDIKVVTVPQLDDLTVDLEGIENAITSDTIGIIGSAPNWPYGLVDPIEAFGQLAIKNDLWLHVDSCVGGYILPFMIALGEDIPNYNLSVPGVRSMSADLHKYGYAPKPCSTVLWKSEEEQAFHYMPITEWACGLYMSQSFIGSRPLGPVAGVWALMHYWGEEGYKNNAQRILDMKQAITDKVNELSGLFTWDTHGPLMMIAAKDYNIQLVVGGMERKGWRLLGVATPPAIHLTLDVMNDSDLNQFLSDLEEIVQDIISGKQNEEGLLSYGGVGAAESAPKWLLRAVDMLKLDSH